MDKKTQFETLKQSLADEIIRKIGDPIDPTSVLIALEMSGVTEQLAESKYGESSLKELADGIFRRCKVLTLRKEKTIYKEKYPIFSEIKRFLSSIFQGTGLAIPMIIQMISIGLIGISLWAYVGFTEELAIFIAIGTFLSYVVTGGFVQAIGRKGLQYLSWENPILAKNGVFRIYKEAAKSVLLVGLFLTLIMFLLNSFKGNNYIYITLGYYLLLSFLWLNLSVLYVTKKILAIIVSVSFPILIILFTLSMGVNIINSQLIGLLVSNILSFFWGYEFFYTLPYEKEKLLRSAKLPPSDWFRESYKKYFLFGVFYFSFLIYDRIINWGSSFIKDGILFNSSYEIGLDFSLIFFPIFLIIAEYAMRIIFGRIIYLQKNFKSTEVEKYNQRFTIYYIIIFCLIPLASLLVYWIINPILYNLYYFYNIEIIGPLFNDPLTRFVFNTAYFAYSFVGIGLFNSLLFISHSRPEIPFKSIIISSIVNILSGVLLSRLVSPEFSVVGLLFGSIVFFVMTTIASFNLTMDFDYATFSK